MDAGLSIGIIAAALAGGTIVVHAIAVRRICGLFVDDAELII